MKSTIHKGTSPDGQTASSSFNWSKIHLVYFALAAFDLIAIATGLMLSEWSNAAHHGTVAKLEQVNFLRDELKSKQTYVAKLSSIADEMATSGDMKIAQRDLAMAETSFAVVFSEPGLNARVSEYFHKDGDGELRGAIHEGLDEVREHLGLLDGALIARFDNYENNVRSRARDMLAQIRKSFEASYSGSLAVSAQHASRSDLIFDTIIADGMAYTSALDWAMEKTVKESEATFKTSALLQYVVGGAILVMILLACAYAHFMGKLLKSKYRELQTANVEAEAFSDQMQRANDDVTKLNKELADSIKQLKDAQDELVKKGRLEQLGQLTATVAHELRNPLGAVRTSAFLMERKLAGKELGVEPQLLRITNGILRCDNIITQLLDFSRTKQLETLPADLDQWLEKVVCEEAGKLPAAVQITCETSLGGRMVPFDAARLQRAMVNLLSNASEALVGKGDDPEKFAVALPKISVSTRLFGDDVQIVVADNGKGIALENLEKIREPLFTTKSFGTGLGIPAVEQIMKQHGGSLHIESVPGQGARFILQLPATMPLPMEQEAA
jgi:signal transduction histidine kinase